jgi:hypothetical protein
MLASSAIQTKLEGQIITQKANLIAGGPQKDLKTLPFKISPIGSVCPKNAGKLELFLIHLLKSHCVQDKIILTAFKDLI